MYTSALYNGENYQRVELNDQKASNSAARVRPFADGPRRFCEAFGRISSTTMTTMQVATTRRA